MNPQKNIRIKKNVIGKNDDSLFSRPNYNSDGDAYFDQFKRESADQLAKNRILNMKVPFKSSDNGKSLIGSAYPHISDKFNDGAMARHVFPHSKTY